MVKYVELSMLLQCPPNFSGRCYVATIEVYVDDITQVAILTVLPMTCTATSAFYMAFKIP